MFILDLQVDNLMRAMIKDSCHRVVGQTLLDNYFANPFIINVSLIFKKLYKYYVTQLVDDNHF